MFKQILKLLIVVISLTTIPSVLASSESVAIQNLTDHWMAWLSLFLFILAYLLVFGEGRLSLKKSKPMMVVSGLIWIFVALSYSRVGDTHSAEVLFRQTLVFYVELFLFLLASSTYVNAMSERGVFENLRETVMSRNISLRGIFWVSGMLTFILSAILANFAVVLVLATILLVLGKNNHRFIVCGCINIVVAANAGGSFSPFGDVTSLMVWQGDLVSLKEFPNLFLPSLVNWLVPAFVLSFAFNSIETQYKPEKTEMSTGAWIVSSLFAITLILCILSKQVFHLPAALGVMTGLGLLKLYGYYLKRTGITHISRQSTPGEKVKYDIFRSLERSEWDTLMFLYGLLVSISGLAALGYLEFISSGLYQQFGATQTNILLGALSAFIDNAAVMYGVILMQPEMEQTQWLLITLTAGVGGSLLAIGSIAGVVTMGISNGIYTFMSHLKWSWAIALGYFAAIGVHLLIN